MTFSNSAASCAVKPLKSILIDLIRLRGPLSVSQYMKLVLTNPASGFYMNNDVFGVKGHFITSPEISQMFGEILGIWFINEWKRLGMPAPLRLIEFGPGRGTLMSDIVRTMNKFDYAKGNLSVDFIEISPHLKEIQAKTLANSISSIKWHTHIEEFDLKEGGFNAFIAHEYLDALPIHKFVRDPASKHWKELVIDYDERQELRFCLSNAITPSLLLIPENFNGDHIEINAEGALQLEKVASLLNKSNQGCMLICDYGFDADGSQTDSQPNRDTFRGFKNHALCPPLIEPGKTDLTADVDFNYMKKHLKDKALVFGSVSQKQFLGECGLKVRLDALAESTPECERENLISEANMMMEDMGQRYRFMSFFPKNSGNLFSNDPPAGFASHLS